MNNLLKKKEEPKNPMQIQANLIATALVRELRVQAMGIGWALAPGLFFGFLAMAFVVSMCVGFGWFVFVSL
jgi:Tfp pilus assembly protein PilO